MLAKTLLGGYEASTCTLNYSQKVYQPVFRRLNLFTKRLINIATSQKTIYILISLNSHENRFTMRTSFV
nr:unnamed protein product [Callosobruchus analis]